MAFLCHDTCICYYVCYLCVNGKRSEGFKVGVGDNIF